MLLRAPLLLRICTLSLGASSLGAGLLELFQRTPLLLRASLPRRAAVMHRCWLLRRLHPLLLCWLRRRRGPGQAAVSAPAQNAAGEALRGGCRLRARPLRQAGNAVAACVQPWHRPPAACGSSAGTGVSCNDCKADTTCMPRLRWMQPGKLHQRPGSLDKPRFKKNPRQIQHDLPGAVPVPWEAACWLSAWEGRMLRRTPAAHQRRSNGKLTSGRQRFRSSGPVRLGLLASSQSLRFGSGLVATQLARGVSTCTCQRRRPYRLQASLAERHQ